MKREKAADNNFQPDEIVTYFPIKLNADDNRHWPAKVLTIAKRIQVAIDMPGGVRKRWVTQKRLAKQAELFHDP